MPCLNEEEGIAAALDALAPLRRGGAEVIVVDGGSVDCTAALGSRGEIAMARESTQTTAIGAKDLTGSKPRSVKIAPIALTLVPPSNKV